MTVMTRRDLALLSLAATAVAASPSLSLAAENWRLGFKTPPKTLDSELKLIEGRLPAGLQGNFYRVGPAQFERAGERLGHWFDGDGMMQRFAIAGGRVHHRGRFVDTPKRREEEAAGRFLYSGFGFAPKSPADIRNPDTVNAANTAVLPIDGEVWALWEGGSPYRIDPQSLETRGRKVFERPLDGVAFSAHPKRGSDGDVWNFGLLGGSFVIWHLAPDASVRKAKLVELPEASLMHDFAVTSKHIILLLPPMNRSKSNASTLVDHYTWQPDKPLIALVLDKDTLTIQRRYELPARFLFHIGNAWEDEAGTIRLDAFLETDATFATKTARDLALVQTYAAPTARLNVITLPVDGRATMEALPGSGEFPRIDQRLVGRKHRYTYGVIANGVARWDLATGKQETFSYGPNTWSEEPVFTPRPDATDETGGWLTATALNYGAGRTELAVFDARRLSDGPIARLACPYALPLGFHGAFVTA